MSSLEKLQPVIIFIAVITGLVIGDVSIVGQFAEYLIVPFLMLMLYGIFLLMPMKRLFVSLGNVRFIGTSLFINFLWTPAVAYGIGMLFLSEHPLLWIGFIMLTVTPCTDWYLVFTNIARGDSLLSTSLLPINLILQILLLPVYLYIFFGIDQTFGISLFSIFSSIIIVVGVPMLLAVLTRKLLRDSSRVESFFDNWNVLFLGVAVLAMFASERDTLLENYETVLLLLLPLAVFFIITFLAGVVASRWMGFDYRESVSLIMMTLARNSPLALAIAITAFPDQPLIALALVIGPLIELPVLAVVSRILIHFK